MLPLILGGDFDLNQMCPLRRVAPIHVFHNGTINTAKLIVLSTIFE
jgi:hypothetical protein